MTRRYRKNPFGISPVWLAVAAGGVYLWKTGRLDSFLKTKPKFFMAARFTEDGRLVPGGNQCFSPEQNAWVAKTFCGGG